MLRSRLTLLASLGGLLGIGFLLAFVIINLTIGGHLRVVPKLQPLLGWDLTIDVTLTGFALVGAGLVIGMGRTFPKRELGFLTRTVLTAVVAWGTVGTIGAYAGQVVWAVSGDEHRETVLFVVGAFTLSVVVSVFVAACLFVILALSPEN
ncbi:MAG TPA: hypothetical protein VMW80_01325 [Candidatus Dormibacteraeota bacterium]|jgi:hypothetical protein|nr:hypothetical protein [Candidatus Dormibacteraeota bacterium]